MNVTLLGRNSDVMALFEKASAPMDSTEVAIVTL